MATRTLSKVFGLFALTFLWGCEPEQPQHSAEATSDSNYIVAVNNPLAYFAERLMGQETEVRFLAPEVGDPAMWRPQVADVLALQAARLVLLNGAGYEGWLDKVSVSAGKLVNTSDSLREQWIPIENQVTHTHGPGGEHAHGDYAFTTWMDLTMAAAQARAVAAALQRVWPEHEASIEARLGELLADLKQLDAAYAEQASRLSGRPLIYSHPVYQYFERRYELPGTSLHWEPDVMPEEEQWQELQRLATTGTALFVWEGQPTQAISDRMRKIAVRFVVIDPAANRGEMDWLEIQRANIARLEAVPGGD